MGAPRVCGLSVYFASQPRQGGAAPYPLFTSSSRQQPRQTVACTIGTVVGATGHIFLAVQRQDCKTVGINCLCYTHIHTPTATTDIFIRGRMSNEKLWSTSTTRAIRDSFGILESLYPYPFSPILTTAEGQRVSVLPSLSLSCTLQFVCTLARALCSTQRSRLVRDCPTFF
jgi:hypothetical protein